MKFIADNMLGKLAKYLRFLGYDTLYFSEDRGDDFIIEMAEKEDRIILTRDRELHKIAIKRGLRSILIEEMDFKKQLKFLKEKLNLSSENMLSLCSICNYPLRKIPREYAVGKVPEKVLEYADEFYICDKCGRIYWYGSHTEKIEKTLMEVMSDENS